MVPRFARPIPVLSMVTNEVLDYIYIVHSHRIIDWNPAVLNPGALQTYAQVISQRGSPLKNRFGFVDGTVRPIARPDNNQRVVYNGHKRVHALKFQSLALPNGLIGNLYGNVVSTSVLFFKFPLYVEGGSQWQIQVLKRASLLSE